MCSYFYSFFFICVAATLCMPIHAQRTPYMYTYTYMYRYAQFFLKETLLFFQDESFLSFPIFLVESFLAVSYFFLPRQLVVLRYTTYIMYPSNRIIRVGLRIVSQTNSQIMPVKRKLFNNEIFQGLS
jgi:hypothetical protein